MLKIKILKKRKNAQFFSIDLIFSIIILLLGFSILLFQLEVNSKKETQKYQSYDMLFVNDYKQILDNIKIEELNNSDFELITQNYNYTKDKTLIETLYYFHFINETNKKNEFIDILENYGFDLTDFEFSEDNFSSNFYQYSNHFILSIYDTNKPVSGYLGNLLLRPKSNKLISDFLYFGGFIGQGNISVFKEIKDVNIIKEISLNILSNVNYSLFVNNNYCIKITNQTKEYNLTHCTIFLENNVNLFDFKTLQERNESYVSGGYIQFKKELDTFKKEQKKRIFIPGIDGYLNIYDGISLEENGNVELFINYSSIVPLKLMLGNNEEMLDAGNNTYKNTFSLTKGTYPFRLKINSTDIISTKTNSSSTVLTMDISGSMDYCGEYSNPLICRYNCYFGGSKSCEISSADQCSGKVCGGTCWIDYSYRIDCEKTRISLAKNASHMFINEILKKPKADLGFTLFNTNSDEASKLHELSKDNESLHSFVDSINADGGTGICCGLNKARQEIEYSDSQSKYIVLLSDGEPNYCCDSIDDTIGTSCNTESAKTDSLESAQEICDEGINLITIKFGEDADEQHLIDLACNDSLYFNSENASSIVDILTNISEIISIITTYESQKITLNQEDLKIILYNNSYYNITYHFVPTQKQFFFEEIINFSSNYTFNISNKVTIIDSELQVFSDDLWVKNISINENIIYNIIDYSEDFSDVGDPFYFKIPNTEFIYGENEIKVNLAKNIGESMCSNDNKLIIKYELDIKPVLNTKIYNESNGCLWHLTSIEDKNFTVTIGNNLEAKECYYNPYDGISYNNNDLLDILMYELLEQLDLHNNKKVLEISFDDFELKSEVVGDVPYLYGPNKFNFGYKVKN